MSNSNTLIIIFLSLISLISIATTLVAFLKNKGDKFSLKLKELLTLSAMAIICIIAIGNFVINSK